MTMTSGEPSEDDRGTTLDAGRVLPRDGRETTLDAGRTAPPRGGPPPGSPPPPESPAPPGGDEGPLTQLDPGRTRPASGSPFGDGLPPLLDARFKVAGVMRGAQAAAYVVEERATGVERVVKLYREGSWSPEPKVWEFLRQRQTSSLVDVIETGSKAGRYYEVMEYLAGGTLEKLRRDNPTGLDAATLTKVVRQLTAGLRSMHEAQLVHRDLKPGNVLVRSLDPFEVAIVDFGISQWLPDGPVLNSADRLGTPPYTPPELTGGMVSEAMDWWSLGVTMLELSTGARVLEGLEDDKTIMNVTIVTKPLNVSAVTDPRIRLLCRGLLVRDPDERWGLDQVQRWLKGESPSVSWEGTAPERQGRTADAAIPYRYRNVDYVNRDELALAMTITWETALGVLFGPDREPLRLLIEWLRQFDVPRPPRRRTAPPNVRLFDFLRMIDPGQPPVYRNENIAVARLPELARRALDNEGAAASVVNELRTFDLLPQLALGVAAPGLFGGDGLLDARERWEAEEDRWFRVARLVTDEAARQSLREMGERQQAIWLYAATAKESDRDEIRRVLAERDRALKVPWFTALVTRPQAIWVAYFLVPVALRAAQAREDAEREAEVRREWLRRTEALREWSRRQNRPQALARAVSGVAAFAAGLVLMVGVSDIAGVASDASILDAWFAVVASCAVVLAAESVLAWEIGGRYLRYSLLGAGVIALGRWARTVRRRQLALPVLLGVLAAVLALAVFAPVITPVAAAVAISAWAVARFQAWQGEVRQERADIARAEEELADGAGADGANADGESADAERPADESADGEGADGESADGESADGERADDGSVSATST